MALAQLILSLPLGLAETQASSRRKGLRSFGLWVLLLPGKGGQVSEGCARWQALLALLERFLRCVAFGPYPGSLPRAASRGLAEGWGGSWERTSGGTVHFTLREVVTVRKGHQDLLAGWAGWGQEGRLACAEVRGSAAHLIGSCPPAPTAPFAQLLGGRGPRLSVRLRRRLPRGWLLPPLP